MTWLLRNARLWGVENTHNILLKAGKIFLDTDEGSICDADVWDLEGRLVLPGLTEIHAHLDKTYSHIENPEGTLRGAIENFKRTETTRQQDDIRKNALAAVRHSISFGTTKMRSHLNLSQDSDLDVLRVLNEVRYELREAINIQFAGMMSLDGTREERKRLESALDLGLDIVGGAPALMPDPTSSVATALNYARDYDTPIDLHIDETEDSESVTLLTLADACLSSKYAQAVTASHCCSLAFQPPEIVETTASKVAAAHISVVALPLCNLVLMGRSATPKPRGMTPVTRLIQAGINVCAGSDNVSDPFNPFGNYDPLMAASLTALVDQRTGTEELVGAIDLVTRNAAKAFDGTRAEISNEENADLVVLDEVDPLRAICAPSPRLATFHLGKLIFKAETTRTWHC